MAQSTQNLPDNYEQGFSIDLARNKNIAILLNLAALGVMVLTFWLLSIFITQTRPELVGSVYSFSFSLVDLLFIILLVIVTMGVHEVIHGLFFWLFTRSMPVFGLSLSYAFAAAPNWYIPTNQYWIIGLSPLLLIDITALLLIAFSPAAWILPAVVAIGFNTGGSVGDMWIIYKLFRTGPACLVNDTGHSIHFFMPGKNA